MRESLPVFNFGYVKVFLALIVGVGEFSCWPQSFRSAS
jgi:hypothetical protein